MKRTNEVPVHTKNKVQRKKVKVRSKRKDLDKIMSKPQWRKITGGTHYHDDGQVVKFDEILYANREELSERNQRKFELLTRANDKPRRKKKEVDNGKQVDIIQSETVSGKFDVINPDTGKKINEVPLTAAGAKKLANTMEGSD